MLPSSAELPIYRKSRNYGGLKHTETREFGSMRRRSALTKPDILVELFDFAFRGKENRSAPRLKSGLSGCGRRFFLQCLAEACEKTGWSTPYSSPDPI
jgi:hypothetical protein